MNKHKLIRYFFALIMIVLMVGVSEWLGEKEILFPEMAALVLGLWVIDKKVWTISRPMLVLLMTACALFGILLVRYSEFPLLVNIIISFAFTSICLIITRTSLIPITSATMLPVLLGTDSLVYPISVFVMSLLVVCGQWLLEKNSLRTVIVFDAKKGRYKHNPKHFIRLLFWLILIAVIPIAIGKVYIIVPPLVVMFVEFSSSSSGFRNRPLQVYSVVLIAAILGTLLQYYLHAVLGFPQLYVVLLLFLCLFLLFEIIKKPFAPACAIALVPMIIPQDNILSYPFQVAVGAGAFLFVAMFFFQKCYRWKREHLLICFIPEFIRCRMERPKRKKKKID
ncbi:HPP family protein [Chryseobacterium bernardetii]|uniref:HPP family protein n=1 Tax=Chryseobacterium bernardetii TaxID=1241978 RepID=A0A3G6TAU1_9FLAO|nr:HPP family protein [Chryseobacterium bernardetii]AZB23394.1 HPP family protein [Chryseobacterium bernardetii]